MLTLSSARACAFVCGGCGLSSALHAGPPASHHALTPISYIHIAFLMLASLGELGTAVATTTPERRGLTMPRIADRRKDLVGVGTGEANEIRVPLPRQERSLLDVAVLAGGRDVTLDGAAAADQRHHVIEGEGARAHRARAIVAPPVGNAPLPPAALAKLARAGSLAPEGGGVLAGNEPLCGRHGFSTEARESERSSHSFMSQAALCAASFRCCARARARSPSRSSSG